MLTLEFPTGVKHTKNTLTKCTHERGTEKEKEEGEQMEGVMSLHKSVCVCAACTSMSGAVGHGVS